jgi:hypothetical protein
MSLLLIGSVALWYDTKYQNYVILYNIKIKLCYDSKSNVHDIKCHINSLIYFSNFDFQLLWLLNVPFGWVGADDLQ